MNKYIKYIIENNYLGFNPSEIEDNSSKKKFHPETVKDIIYFRPKNPELLKKDIEFLLSRGIKNLNCIDVSGIIDFSKQFKDMRDLEGLEIDLWDVSNGQDFTAMFAGCHNFNSDISKWDMRNARKCFNMFNGCYKFDLSLKDWKLPLLQDAANMFANCLVFSSDLSEWVLPNATDVYGMFTNCRQFDKSIIEAWKDSWLYEKIDGYESIYMEI